MYACSFIDMLLVLLIRTMSEHSPNMVRTHSEHDEPGKGCTGRAQMESEIEPLESMPKQTSSEHAFSPKASEHAFPNMLSESSEHIRYLS